MTSYRRINSRTINRVVQQQDNMIYFNKSLPRTISPNYFSVSDASNTSLLVSTCSPYSATATRDLLYDGTTFDVLADMAVDGKTSLQDVNVLGNLDVTGTASAQDVNVLGKLAVDGNTDLSGNLAIAGNVTSNGIILAKQFLPGQVINILMLGSDDIPQGDVNAAANTTTTLFTYTYTPKSATSYLLIEYQSKFDIDDSDSESAEAGIFVEGVQISYTYQNFHPTDGLRTSIMFPIVGRYTNSSTTNKSIQVKIISATDDVITVKGDTSTWLKITEIGR